MTGTRKKKRVSANGNGRTDVSTDKWWHRFLAVQHAAIRLMPVRTNEKKICTADANTIINRVTNASGAKERLKDG